MASEAIASSGRPFADIASSLSRRCSDIEPFLNTIWPDLQPRVAGTLAEIDTITGMLPHLPLPDTLRLESFDIVHFGLNRLSAQTKKPEEAIQEALRFFRGLQVLGVNLADSARIAERKHRLDDYPRYEVVLDNLDRSLRGVMPVFKSGDNKAIARNTACEVLKAQAKILDKFTGQAVVLTDAAFEGRSVDIKQLDLAGKVLRQAIGVNEEITEIDPNADATYKDQAVRLILALMKYELADSATYEVSQSPVQCCRERIEALYPDYQLKNEIRQTLAGITGRLSMKDLYIEAILMGSATAQQAENSARIIEADEWHWSITSRSIDNDPERTIAVRLRENYSLLGWYQLSQKKAEPAAANFRSSIKLSTALKEMPSFKIMMQFIEALRLRSQTLTAEDREMIWFLNIKNRLLPLHALNIRTDQDIANLTAEIVGIEQGLVDSQTNWTDESSRLAAAIIWVVEEPSEESVSLLEMLSQEGNGRQKSPSQDTSKDSRLTRYKHLAHFFLEGWRNANERWSYGRNYNPLAALHRHQLLASCHDLDNSTRRLEKEENIPADRTVRTKGAALRVMVRLPYSSKVNKFLLPAASKSDIAAPVLVRAVQETPAGEAIVRLDTGFAGQLGLPESDLTVGQLLEILPSPQHLTPGAVQVVRAVAILPFDRTPYPFRGEQTKCYFLVKTAGPTRILVVREGRIVGSFITTAGNPTIGLTQISGNSSYLWEPNLREEMTEAEREAHGPTIGTFQIICVPILPDNKEGGGDREMVPVPAGGLELAPASKDYASVDPLGDLEYTTALALLQAALQRAARKETVETDLKFIARQPAGQVPLSRYFTPELLRDPANLPVVRPPSPTFPGSGGIGVAGINVSRVPGPEYGTYTGGLDVNPALPVSMFEIGIAVHWPW